MLSGDTIIFVSCSFLEEGKCYGFEKCFVKPFNYWHPGNQPNGMVAAMALIALVSTITATAIETTTAEIVARIPITMDPVAGATIKTTAPVMAVVLLSLTEIIIRGIEAMIQEFFLAV